MWELVARESIRDLIARYNANGDSGRFDDVLALFADDAVMDAGGTAYIGKAGIRSLFDGTAAGFDGGPRGLRHFTATSQIDLASPERATARSYYQVLLGDGLDHWGRYLDEFSVVDGRWLFTRRRVTVDGTVPGSWAAGR
jgi:ketosteroid isomerase-like protein